MSLSKYGIAAMAIAAMACVPSLARADLLTYWDFNNSTAGTGGNPGTFNSTGSVEIYNATGPSMSPASQGAKASNSTITFSNLVGGMGGGGGNNWGDFAGDTQNMLLNDTTGGAFAAIGLGNNGKYITFSLDTVGYSNLVLTYDTRGTVTGFSSQTWAYSTDGTNFTSLTPITGRNVTTWSVQTVDLSSISALNEQSAVYLQVTFDGATSSSGNNRIDNVQFNATQDNSVPEPASLGVMALGAVGLLTRRKSR